MIFWISRCKRYEKKDSNYWGVSWSDINISKRNLQVQLTLWFWMSRSPQWCTGSWFSRQSWATFAENPGLQLWLCKLCDCDCANPTDPSNHIVANHQQVALGNCKARKKRAEDFNSQMRDHDWCRLLNNCLLQNHFLISAKHSLQILCTNKSWIVYSKTNHFVLLQIGTTARSWNQWMRQFQQRSRWQVLDQVQVTIRPPAREVTRTQGVDPVQAEDTAPRRESDWSFNPLVGWLTDYYLPVDDQRSQHCHTVINTPRCSLLNPKPTSTWQSSNDWSPKQWLIWSIWS